MIKEKFLRVLLWFRDHFQFLLEVVFRLSLGIEKKNENQEADDNEDTSEKGVSNDTTTGGV